MRNKIFLRNAPLYLLALSNLVYALNHGFSWFTYLAMILTAIVLIWDVWEAMRSGKK